MQSRISSHWRRAAAATFLVAALDVSAASFNQPVDLPNLVFVGRKGATDIPPVQVPSLSFAGRLEAVLPPVQLQPLQFAGRGDPKGFEPITTPSLNFKGRMPQ